MKTFDLHGTVDATMAGVCVGEAGYVYEKGLREVPGSFSTCHSYRTISSPMRSVLIPSKAGASMTHLPSSGPDYFKLPPT